MGLIPNVDSCCCICPLRTGAILAGWWGTLTGFLATICYIWLLSDPSQLPETKENKTTITISLVILLIVAILKFIFSVALLFGIYQERPGLFVPWIVYSTISLLLDICGYITMIAASIYIYKIIPSFIGTCIFAYFIVIVYSYKKELRH